MPRTSRAAVGGYCYQVLDRGNRRAEVFHGAGDYAAFSTLLRQATAQVPIRLLHRIILGSQGDPGPEVSHHLRFRLRFPEQVVIPSLQDGIQAGPGPLHRGTACAAVDSRR